MTRRRRRAQLVLLAVAAMVAGAFMVPTNAPALTGKAFNVPALGTVEVDQGPIPGNDPASATAEQPPDPPTCDVSPSCMHVPFTIEVPKQDPGDDFVVNLEFSWVDAGFEDIDFWVYDDGQTKKNEGSSGYTVVGSSASGNNPEKVRLFEPLFGRYHIVANNFAGASNGWHIKAQSSVGKFSKPFEALAPPAGGPATTSTTTTTVARAATGPTTTTTVTVAPGAGIPAGDLQGGALAPEQSSFDSDLAAGQRTASALRNLGKAKPPSPSALAVIGWMVVFPAAIAGAFVLVLRTRRRRGLHAARARAAASG